VSCALRAGARTSPLAPDRLTTFLLYLGFGGVAVASYSVSLCVEPCLLDPSSPGVDPLRPVVTFPYP
jgi:hypothetical protein